MTKICSFCNKEVERLWFSSPKCCASFQCKKAYNQLKSKNNTNTHDGKKVAQKSLFKARKPTGEYALFLKIFADVKGVCQVTGEQIKFDVCNFAHILAKGAYPGFRLNPENILHVKPEIHSLYDNSSKENLLNKYPDAEIFFIKKDELRYKYYNDEKST